MKWFTWSKHKKTKPSMQLFNAYTHSFLSASKTKEKLISTAFWQSLSNKYQELLIYFDCMKVTLFLPTLIPFSTVSSKSKAPYLTILTLMIWCDNDTSKISSNKYDNYHWITQPPSSFGFSSVYSAFFFFFQTILKTSHSSTLKCRSPLAPLKAW